jgi:hypothetical protein
MSEKKNLTETKTETKIETKAETKTETKAENKIFFIKFLSLNYNIINLEDCINWCKNNIDLHIITINRILDVTWEAIIKPEDFTNYETMDKLIKLYILIYKNKYKKDIEYHIMDKILRHNGKKLLNTNLLYYSNRSYQKKIKKSIYNNI